jgi:hypothetical protein
MIDTSTGCRAIALRESGVRRPEFGESLNRVRENLKLRVLKRQEIARG